VLHGGEDVGPAPLLRDLPAEGEVYLATAFARDRAGKRQEKFAAAFRKRFGEPPDLDAALAYDAVQLLAEALEQAEGPRREPLQAALDGLTTLESVTGPVTWRDRQARRRLFVVRLQGGEARTVQTVAPE